MSGPITTLKQALDRYKTELPGAPTDAERDAFDLLDAALGDLTTEHREDIRKYALIQQLDVEESFFEQS